MHSEPKSGTQSEDENKSNYFPSRTGSFRNLDEMGHLDEKARDASPYSGTKMQNTSGASRRER